VGNGLAGTIKIAEYSLLFQMLKTIWMICTGFTRTGQQYHQVSNI